MNPLNGRPFAIVSAERRIYTGEVNAMRSAELASFLRFLGLHHVDATGSYEGREEESFLVYTPDESALNSVKGLARYFAQDSVLTVGTDGAARLWFHDDSGQALGLFRQVSEAKARAKVAWTFVDGLYFICAE